MNMLIAVHTSIELRITHDHVIDIIHQKHSYVYKFYSVWTEKAGRNTFSFLQCHHMVSEHIL